MKATIYEWEYDKESDSITPTIETYARAGEVKKALRTVGSSDDAMRTAGERSEPLYEHLRGEARQIAARKAISKQLPDYFGEKPTSDPKEFKTGVKAFMKDYKAGNLAEKVPKHLREDVIRAQKRLKSLHPSLGRYLEKKGMDFATSTQIYRGLMSGVMGAQDPRKYVQDLLDMSKRNPEQFVSYAKSIIEKGVPPSQILGKIDETQKVATGKPKSGILQEDLKAQNALADPIAGKEREIVTPYKHFFKRLIGDTNDLPQIPIEQVNAIKNYAGSQGLDDEKATALATDLAWMINGARVASRVGGATKCYRLAEVSCPAQT